MGVGRGLPLAATSVKSAQIGQSAPPVYRRPVAMSLEQNDAAHSSKWDRPANTESRLLKNWFEFWCRSRVVFSALGA
jgi:hypothetical protein